MTDLWVVAGLLLAALVAMAIAGMEAQRAGQLLRERDEAREAEKIQLQLKIETGWRIQAMARLIDSIWPENLPRTFVENDPILRPLIVHSMDEDHGAIGRAALRPDDQTISFSTTELHPIMVELERSLSRHMKTRAVVARCYRYGARVCVDEVMMRAMGDVEKFWEQVLEAWAPELLQRVSAEARREYYG